MAYVYPMWSYSRCRVYPGTVKEDSPHTRGGDLYHKQTPGTQQIPGSLQGYQAGPQTKFLYLERCPRERENYQGPDVQSVFLTALLKHLLIPGLHILPGCF